MTGHVNSTFTVVLMQDKMNYKMCIAFYSVTILCYEQDGGNILQLFVPCTSIWALFQSKIMLHFKYQSFLFIPLTVLTMSPREACLAVTNVRACCISWSAHSSILTWSRQTRIWKITVKQSLTQNWPSLINMQYRSIFNSKLTITYKYAVYIYI